MSQNPTLSAAAKKLAKATGAKHTVCLRAVEAAAVWTTEPDARLALATQMVSTEAAAKPQPDTASRAPVTVLASSLTTARAVSSPQERRPQFTDFYADDRKANDLSSFDVEGWWKTGRHLGVYARAGAGKTEFARYVAAILSQRAVPVSVLELDCYDPGAAWDGISQDGAGRHDHQQLMALLHEISAATGPRLLIIAEMDTLGGTGRETPEHGELVDALLDLLADPPEGLVVLGVSRGALHGTGPVSTALAGIGDAVWLGPGEGAELRAAGFACGDSEMAPHYLVFRSFGRELPLRPVPVVTGLTGLPDFDVESWAGSATSLGIRGITKSGKTVLAQHLARTLTAKGERTVALTTLGVPAGDGWPGTVNEHLDVASDPEAVPGMLKKLRRMHVRQEPVVVFVDDLGMLEDKQRELAHGLAQLVQVRSRVLVVGIHMTNISRPQPLTQALIANRRAILLGQTTDGIKKAVGLDPLFVMPQERYSGVYVTPESTEYVHPAPWPPRGPRSDES